MKRRNFVLLFLWNTILFLIAQPVKNINAKSDTVEVRHIRNATVTVTYQKKDITILVDPILADKGTQPPISFSNEIKNPTSELPIDKHELIRGSSAVLLTHYHEDHFDREAEKMLSKNILIFCQPGDDIKLQEKGFTNTRVVDSVLTWKGITISRFLASHHKGADGLPPFGESSSFFLQADNESIFFTGDAILDNRLKTSLEAAQPRLIVANTGECQFTKENPVLSPGETMTLTKSELKKITHLLPASKIVAVHMDAINHCRLTKNELRKYIKSEELEKSILVPNEGDILFFHKIVNRNSK